MLLAKSENLTPQPPSLQGKGEPESPSPQTNPLNTAIPLLDCKGRGSRKAPPRKQTPSIQLFLFWTAREGGAGKPLPADSCSSSSTACSRLQGKGEPESPSPLRGGVGEGSDPGVTLPTSSLIPWRTVTKEARSNKEAQLWLN
jgi:hypothetical protein